MAVADEAEGWAEAQRRIAAWRETQADTLDLGGLRLTRVPEELSGLVNLTSLDLRGTGVKDLTPLLKLGKLREFNCSGCQADDATPALWMMPSLIRVILHEATLPGVPAEVLSPDIHTSCLETMRAHFNDLAAGEAEMADVKFMILGNGRVGKTQLCRRLRGEPYDEIVPSTHGIEISSAPLARAPGEAPMATLRIWDFGGQDIYHGTHALFLKSRAIFPLVWTPQSEVTQFHDHGGFTFRNQPLGYWLAYVRSLGGRDSPVLVIQAQCDRPEDERASLPLPAGALDAFPFQKPLRFSAKTDRGRASLDEALADAVTWLRRNQGVDKIGKGRAEVKARLEAMRDDDAGRPPAERRHRLVTQAEFVGLCEKAGNISSPDALLDYLHNCGTVFYRQGLFGDRIILDQAWALDAVYAVFDRHRSYRNLRRYRGRFTRSDLGQWIWDAEGHAPEEQALFLSLMPPSFDFKSERAPGPLRYVSYAHGDDTVEGRDRVAVVDQLCAAAKAKGTAILRDVADMKTGDSITKFMKDLGAADRVFVMLSGEYLRSAYCMFELYEVWRNCRLDTEQLRQRTRVYALPSAGLNSAPALGALIDFWRSENKRIADLLATDPDKVKPKELADYLMMRKFIPHISTIIGHFEDILRPRTVEEFIKNALEDVE